MAIQVIDTHCHLDLLKKKGPAPVEALQRAWSEGVSAVIQIAVDLSSSRRNLRLSEELSQLDPPLPIRYRWTAGLHPESADRIENLDELLEFIREHRNHEEFVGIGETGLDYFHTTEYVENQKIAFGRQLDLARELNLPVVLHLRDDRAFNPDRLQAFHDALEMVRARPGVRGVLHCFTYGYEQAMPFVDLGWMVSYSGIVTYKNTDVVRDGAARLPLETLMVETDAPFLAPDPHRGKTNEPSFVVHTLQFIAELRAAQRGEDPEQVKKTILHNSEKFTGWKDHA